MITTSTAGKIYITAVKSLEKIEVQFLPKELEFSRKLKYGEILIVGRNNPLYHYSGGSNEFTLELDFIADEDNREDVIRRCKLLESWTSNDGYKSAPEKLKVTFGKLFKNNEVWLIADFSYKLGQFKSEYGYLPQQAVASVKFVLDPEKNTKHSDIKWT